MKKNSRLIGIDLFRGIAAYAVVVQHSAIAPVSTLASHFQGICGFAVPFFLATSFLFIAVPERMRYTSTERSLGTHRLGQLTCTSSE